MKKLLCIACSLILCLQACDPVQDQASNAQNYSKFDLFVKRFLKQNPHMGKNDITRNDGNEKFKVQVLQFFNDSTGLSYIPLDVVSIDEYKGGKYIER